MVRVFPFFNPRYLNILYQEVANANLERFGLAEVVATAAGKRSLNSAVKKSSNQVRESLRRLVSSYFHLSNVS